MREQVLAQPQLSLLDLAYSLATTRTRFEHRAAIVAEEPSGLPPTRTIVENVLARPSAALEEQLAELERVRDGTERP